MRLVCRGTFWVMSGCKVPFITSKLNVRFLLKCCRRKGLRFAMTGKPRDFPRVTAGFSSYKGELRMPLVLAQGSPISIQVARESWGLLSSHCRAKRPHLGLCPGSNVPLQGRQGYQGRIPVSPGGSGLVSRRSKVLRCPLESRQGHLRAH